jgi:hypothetical protein
MRTIDDVNRLLNSPEHLENIGLWVVSSIATLMEELQIDLGNKEVLVLEDIELNGGDMVEVVMEAVDRELSSLEINEKRT